ncbi:hypothetical protein DFH09DRAFT_1084942 [Mycena vulgaris]|nr:hypothetical protein DFH09DRAFT_1084942 [Mycena vulgaris]
MKLQSTGHHRSVRSQRRIVAALAGPPYDASSRSPILPRVFANFQGPKSTSNALTRFSGTSRLHAPGESLPERDQPRTSTSTSLPSLSSWFPFSNLGYPHGNDSDVSPEPHQPYHHHSLSDGFRPSPDLSPDRTNHSAAYFDRIRANTGPSIHGGTFIAAQNVHHGDGETGIKILHCAAALEALHDSADSFPQPKYFVVTWACWVREVCHHVDPVREIAGCWMSRGHFLFQAWASDTGKCQGSIFNPRISTCPPGSGVEGPISQAVEDDPSIVAGTPETQLQHLILGPCQSLANHLSHPIIIIDGLDECEGHHMQQEILRVLCHSFPQYQASVRILISTRPEAHITKMTLGACLAFNVEQSFEDVRKYLTDEFTRIHHDHSNTMGKIPKPWPSDEQLQTIVYKSSGHFIYASTIIKFIDDANFRPTRCLALVLAANAEPRLDSPFFALDQLYTQILNLAHRNPQLLDILRVIAYFPARFSSYQIDQLLKLEPGDAVLALRGLHSLVWYHDPHADDLDAWCNIGWHHASFRDFLHDSTRARHFYVGGLASCTELARDILKALSQKNDDKQMLVPMDHPRAHVAWHINWDWIEYLVSSIPLSEELLPLIGLINPDFMIFPPNMIEDREQEITSWFQRILDARTSKYSSSSPIDLGLIQTFLEIPRDELIYILCLLEDIIGEGVVRVSIQLHGDQSKALSVYNTAQTSGTLVHPGIEGF